VTTLEEEGGGRRGTDYHRHKRYSWHVNNQPALRLVCSRY